MSDLYQRSQENILTAEQAQHNGRLLEARVHYLRAAELQRAMVEALPLDRARTRSVYTRSAAALEEKAARANVLDVRPWALDQEGHDVRFMRRMGAVEGDMVAYCVPCGWSRAWSCLEALQRAPEALEDEIQAAILEHIRPEPLTLADLADLGWFGEDA